MPEGVTASVPEFVPDTAPAPLSAWPVETMTDDSREEFYKAVLKREESRQKDSAANRRAGFMWGVGGIGAALVMSVALAVTYVKTPLPPPPGYILVDKQTGVLDQAVTAPDAPKIFPEIVRKRALADYILSCESYIPETFARLDYHACAVMSAPAEQQRRAADIGPKGTRYPPNVFGVGGWAKPTNFYAFTPLGAVGEPPNETFSYQVRYERTEVANGRETRPRYTARIEFSFHPELRISNVDRLVNPTGLQVVAFSTTQD